MCTNSARLVNSLECYMDDLVDCFEDFVKKSLVIISVAVGALILMLGYVLKMVAERPPPTITVTRAPAAVDRTESGTTTINSMSNHNPHRAIDNVTYNDDSTDPLIRKTRTISSPQRSINSITMPFAVKKDFRNTGANTGPVASVPSFNEKVLRNIGLTSASKSFTNGGKRPVPRNMSTSRIPLQDPLIKSAKLRPKPSSLRYPTVLQVYCKSELMLLYVLR